ncbi:MAG TPA: Fe-S oxidoreductase, partial [Lachnospiraceae bacterium]|nr:Fe-S oxidoreductase [Lachnospiraceae bacterium]
NYADWENPRVQSRGCYETAVRHHKPVIVMEPVKGGTLAIPPRAARELMKAADPDASYASWAIRFAASLPGVMVVLSGMSDEKQTADNISYMKDFQPLSEKEQEVIRSVQKILAEIDQIPCTACRYCVAGCPKKINIPGIFSAMNLQMVYDNHTSAVRNYAFSTGEGHGKASDCIHCGQCARQCPQHIQIPEWMDKIAAILE